MSKIYGLLFLYGLWPCVLVGSTTASATVTYSIGSVDAISISGNPGNLNITDAVAGSSPTSATDATTTYAITTNNTSRKVTGALASDMPNGVSLAVNLDAPSGASSTGATTLSTTAANLVTGLATEAQGGLSITYSLSATVSADQVTGSTNSVTYTIGP
jgi:hypothetical protein